MLNIDVWIFDLDHTLYPADIDLRGAINGRGISWMAEKLGLPPEKAEEAFYRYRREDSSVARGLRTHHGLDLRDFYNHIHNIDYDMIKPNPDLVQAIQNLPGTKIVWTNSGHIHAVRILEKLGFENEFAFILGSDDLDYWQKPSDEAYDRVSDICGLAHKNCLLIDDRPENLVPAKARGWHAAYLHVHDLPAPDAADFQMTDLLTFLQKDDLWNAESLIA